MTTLFRRLGRSKLLSLALKLGLTLFAFAYVFMHIEPGQLTRLFSQQVLSLVLAASGLILAQLYMGALRWRMIVVALAGNDRRSITHAEAACYSYIGAFFNCCLPGTVGGDVVRVWLARSPRLEMQLSIYSVVIDRLLSLAALLLLILLMLPVLLPLGGVESWRQGPAVVVFAVVVAFAGLWFLRRILPLLPVSLRQMAEYLMRCLQLLVRHRRQSLLSLFFAVVAHACYCIAGWLLARSMGIGMDPLQALALLPPVLLATTLPISIGGWGVREASAVGLLALAGIPQAAALLLAIQIGLINIVVSLPAGLLWLAMRRRRPYESLPHDVAV